MRKQIMQFNSLEEEMEFWDTHDATEFEAKEVTVEEVLKELEKRPAKRRVTLSLDAELLSRLQTLAVQRHLPMSALVRELLWQGVKGGASGVKTGSRSSRLATVRESS